MVVLASAINLVTLFLGIELLSIPLYVMCAGLRASARRSSPGLKYLVIGSVGSATLLYGLALIYGATGIDRLRRDRGGDRRQAIARRPAAADRHRARARRASPSRHRWRRSTSGRPTSTRARRPLSPRSWRWRPRRPRSRSCALLRPWRCFPAVDDWDAALAALAVVSIVVGNIGAIGQRLAQAHARLVRRRAGRLHPGGRRRRDASSASRASSSTCSSTCS